jgi:sugar-phosphatase
MTADFFPRRCRAILFDLDGVLADSSGCVEAVWRAWAPARGLDAEAILHVAPGRLIRDILAEVAPHLDIQAEVAILDRMEESETGGVTPIDGVANLLASLPRDRWGIVTSGSPVIAARRLHAAGVKAPPVLVTAREIRRGKPDPQGYLEGARRLGVDPPECVVVEDAPAGIAAGKSAGMSVIAVLTTCGSERLGDADAIVPTAGHLAARVVDGGWIDIALRATRV